MPRLFSRLRGIRSRPEPEPSPLRGLGDPSAPVAGAEDAELDALRGELVRELDRMAAGHDGSAAFRRC
jgi:hypothetical protein